MITERLVERFWSRVEKADGCWKWQGSITNKGYGRIQSRTAGVMERHSAHRLSWLISNGAIPAGLVVMHKCDVRDCVRPDHLSVGTIADNNLDKKMKGRSRNQNQSKTHCSGGHELNEQNAIMEWNGHHWQRRCNPCRRQRQRAHPRRRDRTNERIRRQAKAALLRG